LLFPEDLSVPDDVTELPMAAPTEDILDVVRRAASTHRQPFVFRPWQEGAIPAAVGGLYADHRPVLVTAAIGTGKTIVAAAAVLFGVYGNTGYRAKALIASPLVDLAREQRTKFVGWTDQLNRTLQGRQKLTVARRAGDYRVGDIRGAKIILCTYEYERNMLADAEAPISLNCDRLRREWAATWRCLVVDEVHGIMGDRGPVVSSLLAAARHHIVPVLMMTGTTHQAMIAALDLFYDQHLIVLESDPDSECQPILVRLDDAAAFRAAMAHLYMKAHSRGQMTTRHQVLAWTRTECLDGCRKDACSGPAPPSSHARRPRGATSMSR
jgi:hypothetical protein